MLKKLPTHVLIVAAISTCLAAPLAAEDKPKDAAVDYTKMSPAELAEYLIFEGNGFKLDQETQEGGLSKQRITQDELQKTCSTLRGERAGADIAPAITTAARETIQYPEGDLKLGDWKNGEKIAKSGFGFRLSDKPDDHKKTAVGGNCYACHQMSPKEIAFGTLGPSLQGYGKIRGTSEAMIKYTYDMVYNPHSVFACTNMPRFGASGFLTKEEITDVVAYLLDPESPVNQE